MCKQKEIDSAVVLSQVGLLQSINECRAEDVAQNDEFLQWSKQKQRSLVQMSSSGLQCLRYFIGNKQNSTSKSIGIANWTRIMFAFAEHRMSSTVDDVDVQQAARVLLGCDCAPPLITTNIRECTDLSLADARKEFAFYLAASGSSNHVHNAAVILAGNWTATNQFGLSLLSEAVIRSDTEALRSLIKVGFSVNVPVPNPSDVRRPFLFSDYTGWTPLTWAVAKRNTLCIELLLHSKAQVENDAMIKESPIQVAAQLGDEDVVRQLLSFDANAFRSTMEYRKTSVRSVGSPSALAAACARGHSRIVDIFISRLKDCLSDPQTKLSEIGKIEFKTLPNDIQLALQEAIYYAIETGRLISAVQIWESVPDLPWSAYIWARALQFATERGERKFATRLLTNFSPVMIAKLDAENVEYCTLVLFSHFKWECGHEDGNPSTVASVISSLWNHFNKKPTPNDAAVSSPAFQHRPLVDESFVNNKELSDIRFMVDGEIVYAHRIMLFTASERFKELLRSPSGTVDITDISRSSFLAMLRFIYSRTLPELSVSALCCLYAAGEVYVMPSLCTAILADFVRILNPQNVAFIYQFAIVHNAAFLLRRCEEFLLTKLDVLVTYTKIRDMIKCHSNDYDVCEVLSKKLLSVISSTFKE